jgi:hypothetical protein
MQDTSVEYRRASLKEDARDLMLTSKSSDAKHLQQTWR